MSKEPAETITLTARQVALVHDFIFGPQHRFDDRSVCIIGYMELFSRVQDKRPSLLKKLSGCLTTAEALFKSLADQAKSAQLAVQAKRFNPQYDGEFSAESFYRLRRPTNPVPLKAKELEDYFGQLADWAKAVTAFLHATSNRVEQSANDSDLSEVRDETKREFDALWDEQKSLIAEFNTMCGIERSELNQACQMS